MKLGSAAHGTDTPRRPWPGLELVRVLILGHFAPGSSGAVLANCKCPVRSNCFGDGATAANWGERAGPDEARGVRRYLVDLACPLHRNLGEARG